jgi:hypothetical protein
VLRSLGPLLDFLSTKFCWSHIVWFLKDLLTLVAQEDPGLSLCISWTVGTPLLVWLAMKIQCVLWGHHLTLISPPFLGEIMVNTCFCTLASCYLIILVMSCYMVLIVTRSYHFSFVFLFSFPSAFAAMQSHFLWNTRQIKPTEHKFEQQCNEKCVVLPLSHNLRCHYNILTPWL